jgi:hypothetical protein
MLLKLLMGIRTDDAKVALASFRIEKAAKYKGYFRFRKLTCLAGRPNVAEPDTAQANETVEGVGGDWNGGRRTLTNTRLDNS